MRVALVSKELGLFFLRLVVGLGIRNARYIYLLFSRDFFERHEI